MTSKIVAYLGVPGSYSHQASQEIFPGAECIGFRHFPEIFQAVNADDAFCAVVPVDNALTGRIDGIYRELSDTNLNILREYILPIYHCLLVPKGANAAANEDDSKRLARIKQIYSHPQGFLQCENFLRKYLPDAVLLDSTDTANAAQTVAEEKSDEIAAISSKVCAELYGLDVLREDIADEQGNATRFLVLSKDSFQDNPATSPAVTTILFRLKHEPGSLVRALAAFSDKGVNLTKLETYMTTKERRNATFYVDVGEHLHAPRMVEAMAQFAKQVEYWKVLGTYEASPRRGIVSGFLAV